MKIETIKSVRRIFEILELFDIERRPLAAKEIAKQLGYPLMSAHALLKSMHTLGYADFEKSSWSYTPSRSFVNVLDWVPDLLERELNLLDFVAEMNLVTKETINISRRLNTQVRIIYGIETLHIIGVKVKVGSMMPLSGSLTGLTLMAATRDDERTDLINLLDKQKQAGIKDIDRKLIEEIAQDLRVRGTATRSDLYIQGVGAICMPVYTLEGELVIVGIVGPSSRIMKHETEHRRNLKMMVKKYGVNSVFEIK